MKLNSPNTLSMCVHKCEHFAHNYVSNPNTMKCEYCGPKCTYCTLKHGCIDCFGRHGRMGTNSNWYPSKSGFPYSLKKPSAEFQTCIDCEEHPEDPRCGS